jgi:hypothetical protein
MEIAMAWSSGPGSVALVACIALCAGVARAQDGGSAGLIPPPPLDAPIADASHRALLASASLEEARSTSPLASLERDPARGPVDLESPFDSSPDVERLPVAGVDLRLRLELPAFGWDRRRHGEFLRQVSLTHLPPGSLIIDLDGFQGFVEGKIEQRLRSIWLDSLQSLYDAGTLDDHGLRQAMDRMGEAFADQRAGGRWWERTWWEAMPEAKGGAPDRPFVYTIGERLEVFRLGPFALTNDFKGKVDRFMLSLEPDSERVIRSSAIAARFGLARDQARLARDDGLEDEPVAMVRDTERTPSDEPLLRVLFETPEERGGLLAGTGWRVRVRPSLRIDAFGDPTKALKDLSMRVLFTWSPHEGGPSMIEIEGLVRFDPREQDLRAGAQLTFLFF